MLLSNFKINNKYYIILHMYDKNNIVYQLNLRVIIQELIPKITTNSNDYISLRTMSSSKEFIKECGLNSLVVPLLYIKQSETLYDIFKNKLIDDIIYLINQYV